MKKILGLLFVMIFGMCTLAAAQEAPATGGGTNPTVSETPVAKAAPAKKHKKKTKKMKKEKQPAAAATPAV
jgi:hypothetical protein